MAEKVRILIDIGHPAHVHLFRYMALQLMKNGHDVFFTCRDKEFEIYLLKHYDFQFQNLGRKFYTPFGKIIGLLKFDIQEFIAGLKFKPDIFLSHGSMYAAHAAFLLRKPHISLEDTGNWEQVRLYLPFTRCVLTSDIFPNDYGKKQIRFKSHHEIAYLHPAFYRPDPAFREKLALKPDERYVILRFVAWNATHDKGHSGIKYTDKLELVGRLSKNYKVFISSENQLPPEFEKYQVSFAPHEVHDALYNAEMFIGEGTTMAMEAAVLGTPSVYVNTLQYSNVMDMEKYCLLYNYGLTDHVVDRIVDLANQENLKESFRQKAMEMLKAKINLTAFLVWFIENYPGSEKIMKKDPGYQETFR